MYFLVTRFMEFELKTIVMTIETYFFYGVVIVLPFFALISLLNRLRIHSVKLSIKHGLLFGFPLLPTIYASIQCLSIALAYFLGDEESVIKFTGYCLASVFWFLGAAASEQRLVMQEGIILSIHSPRQSLLRWSEVTDYFSKEKSSYTEYHFFRNVATKIKGKTQLVRKIEIVRVQRHQRDEFERLLHELLEPRFDFDPNQIYRNELNQ